MLLNEEKRLPFGTNELFITKPKRAANEQQLDIKGVDGDDFRIILKQNRINPMNFTVIVGYIIPGTTTVFKLRRYNGNSHAHSNKIEGTSFSGLFHIHEATGRYQEIGMDEEAYAEPTDRYQDFSGAIQCMLRDCRITGPQDPQLDLFGGD